jgi:hypothetical protein
METNQAEINIFTVASGLLYEVGSNGITDTSQILTRDYTAICLNHDPERTSKYQEYCEVLVYRKLSVSFFPCE